MNQKQNESEPNQGICINIQSINIVQLRAQHFE